MVHQISQDIAGTYLICLPHTLLHLIQRRGAALLLTSMQAGNNTPRMGHWLWLLLKNKAWLVHHYEYDRKLDLELPLLHFCSFTGSSRLWFFSAVLTRFSCSIRGKKNIIISLQKPSITLEELMQGQICWRRVVILCMWPLQTIFPDRVEVK